MSKPRIFGSAFPLVASIACGLGVSAQGSPTPQFDAIPGQGPGVILSDPTIRPMQSNGPASFFAMRPIDLQVNGRPDLFTCYGIVPPASAQKMPCRVFRPQLDGSVVDVTRQLFGNGALPGAVAPRVIVTGDFNEDGRPDIFIACQGWDAAPFPGEVNVLLLSNSDGTYTDASANLPSVPDFTHDACVGDVNGDGHLDIYVGNVSSQQGVGPYFLLGHGDGTFTKASAVLPASITSLLEKFTGCALVDLDDDGSPDLVLGTHGDGGYLDSIVLFNDGHGGFNSRPRLVLPDGPLGRGNTVVQGIGVLDVNRDGKPDLILTSSQYATFSGFGLQILINRGHGVLVDESVARLGAAAARLTGSPFQAPRFADLNGDGLTDFYFSNGPAENTSRYFLANGDGTFTAVAPNALPQGLNFGVSAVNFDSDARVDLLQIAHSANGDVLYQSFLNHTLVPPIQTYVANVGASPLKAPLTADFSPGSSFTMEGWFYLTSYAERTWLMGKEQAAGGDPFISFGLILGGGDGTKLQFACSTGAVGSYRSIQSVEALPLRTWVHCAAVMDGATIRLLVNGQVVATGSALGAPPKLDQVAFGVGRAFFADGSLSYGAFPGYARQVRFWNVARTAAQISAALSDTLPTDRTGLVADWPLDETSGPTARDVSGAGRALTGLTPARLAVLAAGPLFAETTTPVTDGSLTYLWGGQLIDFDGDGDLDVVIMQVAAPTVPGTPTRLRAFRNNQGTFVDATDAVLGTVNMINPRHFFVGDFNGDGRSDLLIADTGPDMMPFPGAQSKLLVQSADGRLVDETAARLPQHNSFTHNVAAADIDGDGDLDIYTCNIGFGDPGIGPRFYLNNGAGVFSEATDRIPAEIANRAGGFMYTASLLVDVNGDGRPDLVLGAMNDTAANELLLNDGTGHFVRQSQFALPPKLFGNAGVTTEIVSTDLNGDGKPDLIFETTGNYVDAGMQFLRNNGDGTFTDVTGQTGIAWTNRVWSVIWTRFTDFNGDGRPDLLATVSATDGNGNFVGTQPRLFLNVGEGSAIRFIDVTEFYDWSGNPSVYLAADFDRDGKMDLLKVSNGAVTVARSLSPIDPALLNDAPAITTHPVGQTVSAGGAVTLTAVASGFPVPTYQWYRDGVIIAGATGSSYTIAQALPGSAGSYTCVATNAAGRTTSSSAALLVVAPPYQTYVTAVGGSPLKAPATADFAPGNAFTMEGWIYLPDVATSVSHLMGKTFDPPNTDPYQAFALQLWAGNHLVLAQSNGTPGSMAFLNCPAVVPARTWTHVAVVVGGGAMKIYLNGVLSASGASPGAPPNQPAVPFALGLAFYANGDPNNSTFPGYARQVRFWNVARTTNQIATAMTELLPSDATGLVADWPLDELSGTTARDISGHGRPLTVAGGALSTTRVTLLEAGPFFAANATAVPDGSLQYVNPKGALIDFDSDGDLDLIAVQGGPATTPETRSRVRAFRFQNGAYVDATDAVLGTVDLVAPSRTIVADFNGDGRSDVLLAGIGTDAIPWPGEQAKLLLQDATGHLVDKTATNLPLHSADYTHDCTVGDIDGDGDLDIYLGNLNVGAGAPRVYVNNGQGVFTEVAGRLPADIANWSVTYTGCLLTDVNGDGRADLVLGGWAGSVNKNEILLNDGAGTFVRPASPLLPAKMFGADGTVVLIVSADLNGDGKADLLLSTTDHYLHAGLQILLKQNDGTFADATAASGITWNSNDSEIDRIDPVDLNADGKPDLVVHFASQVGSYTRLFLNRGDATFIDATDTFSRAADGLFAQAADVDGDGVVDLVSANSVGVTYFHGLKLIDAALYDNSPRFLTQPLSQTVIAGGPVTFTASAGGDPLPTYQWRKGGVNISGATGGSYTIAGTVTGDTATYTVVATNSLGSATSTGAVLTVNPAIAPAISTQPTSQGVLVGATVFFFAAASGTPTPTYQWQKDGTNIAGETNATLALANVQVGAAGTYALVAANLAGTATSNGAVLAVNVAPVITTHPVSQTVTMGGSVTFTAAATGTPAPTYQWQRGGINFFGATNASLTLTNVQPGEATTYTVVATNPVGSATSNGAVLTVNVPPAITAQPSSQTVTAGGSVTFTAAASGNPLPTYQWKKGAANIAGATNATLTLNNVQSGDATTYTVVATNVAGSVTSNGAVLTVNVPPAITTQPSSQSVTVGGSVTFTAAASGSPAPTYQWKKGASNIAGATNATLTLNNVQPGDAATYTLVATNVVSSATSNGAVLTVNAAVTHVRGDLNGDGKSDILLTNTTTGERAIWLMNGTSIAAGASLGILSTNYVFNATGDFNGDGKTDIFLTNTVTGERLVWLMNGTTIAAGASLGILPTSYAISGVGDFNADGKDDIVLTNTATGDRAVWLMNGTSILAGAFIGVLPTDWQISGIGDFNADGKADIVLTQASTGVRAAWLMNGTAVSAGAYIGILPVVWSFSGVGDFNGDGKSDVVLTNTTTGDRAVWLMNGTAVSAGAYIGVLPTNWAFSQIGDFNGDGKADIFLTDTTTGNRAIWLMNGTTVTAGVGLGVLATNWLIRN